jgi:hypothetical protein
MKVYAIMTASGGEVDLAGICMTLPIAKSIVKALKRSFGKDWNRGGGVWIDEWRVTDTEYSGGKWWQIRLLPDGELYQALRISFRNVVEPDLLESDNGFFQTIVDAKTKTEAIKIAKQRQKEFPL